MAELQDLQSNLRRAAALMIRNDMTLRQAAAELKLPLTGTECDMIAKRETFQAILREEELKLHSELANQPGRNKSTAIGLMVLAIENLAKQAKWADVIAGVEKLAKLEGWVGADSNINIFAGLTAKEIEAQKEKLRKQVEHRPMGTA